MKRFALSASGIAVALVVSACSSSSDNSSDGGSPTFSPANLVLLHTNDIHARLEPINPSQGAPELGGVARVKTIVEQVRAEVGGDRVLTVDAGDYSQGTIFWNAWRSSEAVMFLNDIGYDAVTLGNHEFNLGPANLVDRIEGRSVIIAGQDRATEAARFPVVATNLDLTGEPDLARLVRPSAIVEKGGVRIAILGLVTDTTLNISSPGPNIRFLDYVESVQAEVDRLRREEGLGHFVLLSHVNYREDLRLAEQLRGVDIIVSGHDHALTGSQSELPEWAPPVAGPYPTVVTDAAGEPTLVVSGWEWTRAVGRLNVSFDESGVLTSWSGGPILLTPDVAPDPALAAKVEAYRAPVDEFAGVVIGNAGITFEQGVDPADPAGFPVRVRVRETAIGNLVTDAMLGYSQIAGLGVQAALTNGGGIRASINQGDVTFGDALSVLPFGNSLFAIDVTGEELVRALDNGLTWAYDPEAPSPIRSTGAWPQVSGMTVEYCGATVADIQSRTLPPVACDDALISGGVVTGLEIEGSAVDLAASYRIVTNNFMAGGGDFYASLAAACERPDGLCEDTFFLMLDALIERFEDESPVTREIEGRLIAR